MDKNAIKKYAVWARRELISRVSQRAALYEITDKGYGDASADSVLGRVMSAEEKRQRQALIAQIREKGYEQVMEEIAYTWFNRFIALRFMEVNGYLPSRVRVFTDDENNFKPQIMTEAINMELDGLDMEKVYALKNANDDDALFKYMIIVQCNALSSILPGMFQRISDFTELLFPDNLLREGSVIEQMVAMIPEEDWTDQVQIIGWLYQFYNIEPKAVVFSKSGKINKEEIPAATQLFTPDWIVRYMVENSLGKMWIDGHPNERLREKWKYLTAEAEQELAVQNELHAVEQEYASLQPQEIRVIDPCQGSGHILVYMIDVLVQVYEAYGYTAREAIANIIQYNIWGLDIDERATQLAYFSVMMKARQYDRRFFSRRIQPNVLVIKESNELDAHCIDYFVDGRPDLRRAMDSLCEAMHDAKEYGSILQVPDMDFSLLYGRIEEVRNEETPSLYSMQVLDTVEPLIRVAQALAQKYHVTVTNPPYMAISNADAKLNAYVNENYVGGKTDMFSVFIERCLSMTRRNGFTAMITMQSWLFLTSFQKVRSKVLQNEIFSLAHMGARGFDEINGEVVQTVAFSVRKSHFQGNYIGSYSRLVSGNSEAEKERDYLSEKYLYHTSNRNFKHLPQQLIAYWVGEETIKCFDAPSLSRIFTTREGMATADNETFLRLWHEVELGRITFDCKNAQEGVSRNIKWVPYNKGGTERDWFGNNDYVVDWENDGSRIRNNKDPKTGRIRSHNYNGDFGFREGITWSAISSGNLSVRYCPRGFLFDSKGAKGFSANEENLLWVLGLLNSKVAMQFLQFISPTLDFKVGDVVSLPYMADDTVRERIITIVKELVHLSKSDWDSFETSWGFVKHPLIPSEHDFGNYQLQNAFERWEKECSTRFARVKDLEEELNRLFIHIYGLEAEIDPTVQDTDITAVRKANREREIKSLISYAIGCIFGRYSLDVSGVAYAGGEWGSDKYKTFIPDKDAILPICDDEYFEDDIVGRFVSFVEQVYGKHNLEENLSYIASTIGGKGSAREVIRNYFLNDFFNAHCNDYSITGSGKRPIYWLFDSGKKNGFKCLIYMHRYQPDTIARIRTDYVHEQQSRYRTAIADMESRITNAGTGERVKLSKQLAKLRDQAEELRVYEEKIHHLADQMIRIDLDDGVKHNYAIFQDVLAKIK